MSSKSTGTKKVRLACRRCRTRRIKCDGQLPACGNCAKAGELCADVDSQNADLLVPRDFANAARARIQWLEEIIREKLPEVDLTTGPQIEVAPDARGSSTTDDGSITTQRQDERRRTSLNRPTKRTSGTIESSDEEAEESFQQGAQSVAMNLGMLALNSDSSQKHYLGSSSGLLFTNLIKASSPRNYGISSSYQDLETNTIDNQPSFSVQETLQKRYRSLHLLLRQELPKQEDAILLVQTYISDVHPDFPALDPQGLFSVLNALYECSNSTLEHLNAEGWPASAGAFRWNGTDTRRDKQPTGQPPMAAIAFIIFMVFNVAAIAKVRTRSYEYSPEKFYRSALLFSGDCFSSVSLTTIQALLMLAVHGILTPAEVNLWTLIHVGMAYCIELGIHREPSTTDVHMRESHRIQRNVFYTVYSLDRSISSIQGRPLGFRDETFDTKMPEIVSSDQLPSNTPVSASFLAGVSQYCALQFRLDRIVSAIKVNLYHLPAQSAESTELLKPDERQQRIAKDLQSWLIDVNDTNLASLSQDRRRGHAWLLKLQTRYHSTMLLLFQPSQAIRRPSDQALLSCFESAKLILQNYQTLRDNACLHFGWRAVQNVFAAGATLIYAFWTSKLVQSRASATELTKSLRTCSGLLSVGGEWWPAVIRCKQSFETVVDLTVRKLFSINSSPKRARIEHRKSRQIQPAQLVDSNESQPIQPTSVQSHPKQITIPNYGVIDRSISTNALNDPDWSMFSTMTGPIDSSNQQLPSLWYGADNENSPSMDFSSEVVPEIEEFIADFGNADFSWNFPLSGLDDQFDMNALFSAHYPMG